jgi:AcrR family transcriptional regulator
MPAAKALKWERRPEARIPELLEAALHVFAETGYRRTRLDDVAQRAGVTKGTIYHYFDTKEALLLGVVEHYQALAFGRIEEALQNRDISETERLREVVTRAFTPAHSGTRFMLSLLIQGIATEVPRIHERWLRNGPGRLGTLISGIIARGQQGGEFGRRVDAQIAARGLVAGLLLQLMWNHHGKKLPEMAIDEAALIDGSIEVLLSSLRPD